MPGDLFNRLTGRVRGGQSRRFGLEESANVIDLPYALRIEAGNAHAAVRLVHEQAFGHQLQRGLACRSRSEVQIGHQLALPERLPRPIPAEHDRVLYFGDRQLALGLKPGFGIEHSALYFIFYKMSR